MNLFLSPHNDDETLFGAFTIIRHRPHVAVCFRSHKQEAMYGITSLVRELETGRAIWHLGADDWEQSDNPDNAPDFEWLVYDLVVLGQEHEPEIVWAPAVETHGHDQHNMVAQAAHDVFGGKVVSYLTYERGSMRTRGVEVPFETSWVQRKMRALSCYESQIGLAGDCQPWFMDDTLREYRP